jgi:LmbE family N-acetylglucosaminyl deacetylase
MATIVFFHAHPDDEAIATGGTMALLSDAGDRVVLVTATRGELGELPEGGLADGESLAERRTAELAEAGRILGVHRQVFLDYLDSGMAGAPTNDQPGTFTAADVDEAARRLATILDEESADVLVTYDEHGGYGHPDHIQVHRVGMAAARVADTPVVYLSTVDRDFMASLADLAAGVGWSFAGDELDGVDQIGEPASRLTTEVDVTSALDRKRASMRAHGSQITESSFFLAMPDDLYSTVWGREWYIRVHPTSPHAHDGPFEDALATTPEAAMGAR